MANKRSATTELNHDNWNEENEPEDAGTFAKASSDVIEKRVIKAAKRRLPPMRDVSIYFDSRLILDLYLDYICINYFIFKFNCRELSQKVHLELLQVLLKPLL